VVVTVTTPDEDVAGSICRRLVGDRLAACAQVGGPITSTYRWQGAVETDPEWTVTVKTVADRLDAVVAAVRELHPYELPEVVAVPVAGGHPGYLDWVVSEST
jgi:periplasmic divalent cation tolerance protein